jgi:hypothetical protein
MKDEEETESRGRSRKAPAQQLTLDVAKEAFSAIYESLRYIDARLAKVEETLERHATVFSGWEHHLEPLSISSLSPWLGTQLSPLQGKVLVGDAPTDLLVEMIGGKSATVQIVDIRATMALHWAKRTHRVIIDELKNVLANQVPHSLGCVVFIGIASRIGAADAIHLVEDAKRALAPGGRLIVLSASTQTPLERDLVGHGPLSCETWETVLRHCGFADIDKTTKDSAHICLSGKS